MRIFWMNAGERCWLLNAESVGETKMRCIQVDRKSQESAVTHRLHAWLLSDSPHLRRPVCELCGGREFSLFCSLPYLYYLKHLVASH